VSSNEIRPVTETIGPGDETACARATPRRPAHRTASSREKTLARLDEEMIARRIDTLAREPRPDGVVKLTDVVSRT
jgi:hypothetical protein